MKRCLLVMACLIFASAPAHADEFLDHLRLQIALDRIGFSPGVLDGKIGRKTQVAIKEFARANGMERVTAEEIISPQMPTLVMYTITPADMAEVRRVSRDWNERATAPRMTYDALGDLLAERGHCTRATVARLNPGKEIDYLKAGEAVALPAVVDAVKVRVAQASALVVDLREKIVWARDEHGRTLAMFHCSIAQSAEKRPKSATTVKVVAMEPDYTFDPAMWPEVRNVTKKLRIPPGPRNPVGMAWIGLDLPGYGIHGTPWPELIGKTGSHGCIRLTNWDAVRLARMVRAEIPVSFTGGGAAEHKPRG